MIIVIPTNRQVNLRYIAPLIGSGARVIVVDDSPGSVTVDHPCVRVFNWKDRKRMLGNLDAHFPRRNGACRDFGFYIAWRESEENEIILALDDDCEVELPDFARRVEKSLSAEERPIMAGNGRHMNIFDLYENAPSELYPRGFPYSARAHYERWTAKGETDSAPKFNVGLWQDAFDVNAIDKIQGPDWRHPDARLRHESVVIPPATLVSVCSMNMQFRRSLTPAAFQLPMNVEVIPGWAIDRYGDIWGGFILKTLMDIAGDLMVVGGPLIKHHKSGDLLRNIRQEHIGHMINEEFVDLLAEASQGVPPGDYLEMLAALHEGLSHRAQRCSILLSIYLLHLLASMDAWIEALRRL